MTDEMLALARESTQGRRGQRRVLKETTENIPLPDNSVDVILSNFVINLSSDKDAVLRSQAGGHADKVVLRPDLLRMTNRSSGSSEVFMSDVAAAAGVDFHACPTWCHERNPRRRRPSGG
jgi:methyltransferase family protein